jgi:hypothetical protein
VSPEKREKRLLELVRASKLVDAEELGRAVRFQTFARSRGKPLPLDRILLKFQLLTESQIRSFYLALRYFTWRKEDKFYAKIAVQSQVLSSQDAERCLKEQKRSYREKRSLKRMNEIAREKGLLGPKEDLAIVEKMRSVKPKTTLVALGESRTDRGMPPSVPLASSDEARADPSASASGRGPARKGEEEQWRRDMRARELAELSNAARDDDPLASIDGPLELDLDSSGDPRARVSRSGAGRVMDEDLDPLWDEADLDDVELDSGQAEAARGSLGTRSSDEDETDLFQ